MSHEHLSLEERHYIEIELKAGTSMNQIAKALGRSQSTLSREISRNTGKRGYQHKQANRVAEQRHKTKPKAVKLTDEIKQLIYGYLKQDWSPEQIAGRLKRDEIITLHHDTIYQYILADKQAGRQVGRFINTYATKPRHTANATDQPTTVLESPTVLDIEQRPEDANERKRVGD